MTSPSDLWITSSSPHAHSGESVRGIMLTVIVAMLPAFGMAVGFFGWNAIRLVLGLLVTTPGWWT